MQDLNSMTAEKKRVRVLCWYQESVLLQLLGVSTYEQHMLGNCSGADPPPGVVQAFYTH